jgi:hypothetical protein
LNQNSGAAPNAAAGLMSEGNLPQTILTGGERPPIPE